MGIGSQIRRGVDDKGAVQSTTIPASSPNMTALTNFNQWVKGAIQLPAAMTGTTFTWEVSVDGVNYKTLKDQTGAAYGSLVPAANAVYTIPTDAFSYPFFRIVSGSSEAAARTIYYTLSG